MSDGRRVLVLGLDGATWSVLDPWIRDGTLPNLGRLRARGSWGSLRSTYPPITPAAWGTFMTGKRPGKHGVFHFVPLFGGPAPAAAADGRPAIVSAMSLRSATLWDQLGHHGRRVGLVNIPLTYPPRPVNGFLITGMLTPPDASIFTFPPELSAGLGDYMIDLGRFADKVPFVDAIEGEDAAPSPSLIAEYREMLEQRATMLERLITSEAWDFFMAVFMDTDRLGHYLWGFHGDVVRGPGRTDLEAAIRHHYVRLDEVLGRLIELAGDDVVTFVVSDHGMGPRNSRRFHVNNWLLERGWLVTASDGRGPGAGGDVLLRRLRIPRDRLGRLVLAIPGLRRSRLVRSASRGHGRPIDEVRSVATGVALFNHVFGIHLNVPDPERDRLRSGISAGLLDLRDPQTGRAVVERVTPGEDYYQGPFAAGTPDLIVEADPDYVASFLVQHYSSVVTRLQVVSPRGHHRMEGVLVAAGPGIRPADAPIAGARLEDLAPTILHVMGVPIPDDVDGSVVDGLLEPDVAARAHAFEAPRGIWPGDAEEPAGPSGISPREEAELTARLAALGYLD